MDSTEQTSNTNPTHTTALAKEVVRELLKSKKLMRMYPENNPLYIKASRAIYEKFNAFFQSGNDLLLQIDKHCFYYNDSVIYQNNERENNLALFFFKDGIRLLSFYKGLPEEEIRDFMRILNTDFESEADDDLVTLLWEKEFKYIQYVVDENFLSDWEIPETGLSSETIKSAHTDAQEATQVKSGLLTDIYKIDNRYLSQEIQRYGHNKIEKLTLIFLEMLGKKGEEGHQIVGFLRDMLIFCIKQGDFQKATRILALVKEHAHPGSNSGKALDALNESINSTEFINAMGTVLEGETGIDQNDFLKFMTRLGRSSISHQMKLLGQVQKVKTRRMLVDALSTLGRDHVKEFVSWLSDSRWYVVRNTALILGAIGTPDTVRYLVRALGHEDKRVRKEAVRALGNTGSKEALPHILPCLKDAHSPIRIAAAKSLANIRTDDAKTALMMEISRSYFLSRKFEEKKEIFGSLANWQDHDVKEFLINMLNKKRMFRKAKNMENRACAALALGMIKADEAVASLEKASASKNPLLTRISSEALEKLKG